MHTVQAHNPSRQHVIATVNLNPGERREAWTSTLGAVYTRADVRFDSSSGYIGTQRWRRSGERQISSFSGEPISIDRTAGHCAAGEDDGILVFLATKGSFDVAQNATGANVATGDMVILDTTQPLGFAQKSFSSGVCLKLPAAHLPSIRINGGPVCGKLINRTMRETRLCADVLCNIATDMSTLSQEAVDQALALTTHLVNQIASTMGCNLQPIASTTRMRLIERVHKLVRQRFEDPDFTVTTVAREVGVSESYLYDVFSDAPISVAETIMARRLAYAAECLRAHEYAHRSVSEIAFSSGFKSPAHFATRFKSEYKTTPSVYRREALARLASQALISPKH